MSEPLAPPAPAPATTGYPPFWQQLVLSVTVAVITSLVVEKIMGRRR